jgi:hypothetical protein
VRRFLLRARAAGARVLVVSHKTEYGHFDAARVNLRDAALGWMETHGLVASEGAALARADIHFAATRADKVALIGELGCDQFVDDLEEVLNDPEFPPRVRRVLFARHLVPSATPYQVCRSWREINRAVLG